VDTGRILLYLFPSVTPPCILAITSNGVFIELGPHLGLLFRVVQRMALVNCTADLELLFSIITFRCLMLYLNKSDDIKFEYLPLYPKIL
jgi:hypothetical protein